MPIVFASGQCYLFLVLQPLHSECAELEQKAERLSDLLGVMEDREEQLTQKVLEVEMSRMVAEERVKEKERMICVNKQKHDIGRKVKNTLLLTAAFGAVHQAIKQEMVVNILPI